MAPPVLRPKVSVTTKGDVGFKNLADALKASKGMWVSVGILEPEIKYPNGATLGQVALWHEFGTHNANGTFKMAKRSFIRSTTDENVRGLEREKTSVIQLVQQGRMTMLKAFERLGAFLQVRIQAKIQDGIPPPLRPYTLQRKARLQQPETPLIATKTLFEHIVFAVLPKPGTKKKGGL